MVDRLDERGGIRQQEHDLNVRVSAVQVCGVARSIVKQQEYLERKGLSCQVPRPEERNSYGTSP